MNIALWIIAGVLAVLFLASGVMKLVRSNEKLAAAGMGFAEDFSTGAVKAIGVLEILAAVGLEFSRRCSISHRSWCRWRPSVWSHYGRCDHHAPAPA